MKVFVTGRYVDLNFQTKVPIIIGQQYANESVAKAVAMAIARMLGVKEIVVTTSQLVTTVEKVKAVKKAKVKSSKAKSKDLPPLYLDCDDEPLPPSGRLHRSKKEKSRG